MKRARFGEAEEFNDDEDGGEHHGAGSAVNPGADIGSAPQPASSLPKLYKAYNARQGPTPCLLLTYPVQLVRLEVAPGTTWYSEVCTFPTPRDVLQHHHICSAPIIASLFAYLHEY
jgi:hypothetical protein